MSFRLRLTVLTSAAVAVSIAGTAVVVYITDEHALIGQVDSDLSKGRIQLLTPFLVPAPTALRDAAKTGGVSIARMGAGAGAIALDQSSGASSGSSQMTVGPNEVFRQKISTGSKIVVLPPSYAAVRVHVFAVGGKGLATPRFTTEQVDGAVSRVFTYEIAGREVVAASSLLDVNRSLAHLRLLLIFISLGGIGVAAVLGAIVSGRALAPLRRLTETTERIVDTGDLSERIGQHGRDEISRLSGRLDALLATLEQSLQTQRQLVADASHELRTPIATLRANFELLARPGALGERERGELLADVNDELESMTTLVAELVELARGEELDVTPSSFRLDEVVRTAVDRAARRAPDLSFRAELEPTTVTGVPERVDQAVANLLDNARKWSPPGGVVEVVVRGGVVEVRDQGPGIASDDLPLVFNRFYRAPAARAMPGAGLGLAIVKQIADAHGGSVSIGRASQGGAIVRLELPAELPATDDEGRA